MNKKKCILCDCELECAVHSWESFQPYGGGEVRFIFGYGSREFDLDMNGTQFRGLICDNCAKKYVHKMRRI